MSLARFLHFHKPGMRYHVFTDASEEGLACLLFQEWISLTSDKTILVLVDCYSRKTRKPEKKYSSGELKALTRAIAFVQWRYYLLQAPFVLRTDFLFVKNMYANLHKRDIKSRLARLCALFSEYEFECIHVPGSTHILADYMSFWKDKKCIYGPADKNSNSARQDWIHVVFSKIFDRNTHFWSALTANNT